VRPSSQSNTISGRVLALEASDRIVVLDGSDQHVVCVPASAVDLAPGDLVSIEVDRDREGAFVARNVQRVFRPVRAPFTPGTETHALLADGKLDRLIVRDRIVRAIREHFDREGSLEVNTPTMATSPGLDLHLHAFEVVRPVVSRHQPDESGRMPSLPPLGIPHAYLITSPEYHMKRLLVGGVRRCHQFAKCFRVDEDGARHEPEFTMLEWYRAWDDMHTMLDDTFAIVCAAASATGSPDRLRVKGRSVPLDQGYDVITVREAFARWAPEVRDPIGLARDDEDMYFAHLVDRIEPNLGVERPAFLVAFAARHASLARLNPDDASVCDRFELNVNGIELSNGFVELTDPDEQRERLERDQRERVDAGLPVYPIDERFLAALDEGMPPAVGYALGFDRLVAMATGRDAIADGIAFPGKRR
jgi:lysyl-tRNA synthetase class 2